jgi:hypothetical protein
MACQLFASPWPRQPDAIPPSDLQAADEEDGPALAVRSGMASCSRLRWGAMIRALIVPGEGDAPSPDQDVKQCHRPLPGGRATKTTRANTYASSNRRNEGYVGRAIVNGTDDLANPWLALPESPDYVLADDLAILRRFPKAIDKLVFAGMPGPFVGNPLTARLLLLALHPGFVDSDIEAARDQAIQGPWRDALQLRDGALFHPVAQAQQAVGGSPWWPKKLRRLMETVGAETVMARVAAAEWFPYVSRKLVEIPELLPSQAFTFQVVRKALEHGALPVIMIGNAQWLDSVPELAHYRVIIIRNWQNPTITPGNMKSDEWKRVVAALRA